MKPPLSSSETSSGSPLGDLLRPVVDSFREELEAGKRPRIEDRLQRAPAAARPELCRMLILEEMRTATANDEAIRPERYLERFGLLIDGAWLELMRRSLTTATESRPNPAVDALAWGLQAEFDTERTLDVTGRFDRSDRSDGANERESAEPAQHPTMEFADPNEPVQPPSASAPLALPSMLGKYRLLKLVGKGGFGDVYLAEDPQLDRKVALKTPRVEKSNGSSSKEGAADDSVDRLLEALLDEARNAAKLERVEGVIPIYDAGRIGDVGYIVTPYVEGGSLADLLKRGRLPIRDSLRLFTGVCDIVERAHRAGWTHRDLKPSNILIGDDGRTFLTDFGLSVRIGDRERSETQGTPRYMAPEIARLTLDRITGSQAVPRQETIDGRADLYSLGVTFYQLLTGQPPFHAERLREALVQVVETTPPPPHQVAPDVPLELSNLCMQLLEKDPARRPASAGEVAGRVRRYAERARLDEAPERRANRRRLLALAIGAAGALMVLAVMIFWLSGGT